jgi:hypothetical protein
MRQAAVTPQGLGSGDSARCTRANCFADRAFDPCWRQARNVQKLKQRTIVEPDHFSLPRIEVEAIATCHLEFSLYHLLENPPRFAVMSLRTIEQRHVTSASVVPFIQHLSNVVLDAASLAQHHDTTAFAADRDWFLCAFAPKFFPCCHGFPFATFVAASSLRGLSPPWRFALGWRSRSMSDPLLMLSKV